LGVLSHKIFGDDFTLDVKQDYLSLLYEGLDNDTSTSQLVRLYSSSLADSDECPLFWFALADTQWEYGRLTELVKNKALKYIGSSNNLAEWCEDREKKLELEGLKHKLLST
jgi:hypothetical protein